MWLKLLGAAAVIISCTGMGAGAVSRMKRRRSSLETVRRMMYQLKSEILYGNTPLDRAFARIGQQDRGEEAAFFTRVGNRMGEETGEEMGDIWEEEASALQESVFWTEEDKSSLLRFGMHLNSPDRKLQEKTIALYLDELDQTVCSLREEEKEKSRLCLGGGILSGLFLTVMLL